MRAKPNLSQPAQPCLHPNRGRLHNRTRAPSRPRPSGLRHVAGNLLDDLVAKGHVAAQAVAHQVHGVVARVVAARAGADGVEAGNRLLGGVEDLQVLVDAQTVEGGQDRGAVPAAVEGRVAQLGEAVGLLESPSG